VQLIVVKLEAVLPIAKSEKIRQQWTTLALGFSQVGDTC